MQWFFDNRRDLTEQVACMETHSQGRRLLAIPSRTRLERVLSYLLDENEFLSPLASLAVARPQEPALYLPGRRRGTEVDYEPGESSTWLFGGNSNWRGRSGSP